MSEKQKDVLLDHDADGIREFDNDLPRWWLYGFYLTIIMSVFYLINWHVLDTPLIGDKGQVAEYEAEVAMWAERAAAAGPKKKMGAMTILTDEASLARGKELFNSTDHLCATCHREDLGGMVGPNLTDDHWLHGCSIEEIVKNIISGFPEMGMLPYGSNTKMSDEDLVKVASYILSMRGTNPPDPKPVDPERDVLCSDKQPS